MVECLQVHCYLLLLHPPLIIRISFSLSLVPSLSFTRTSLVLSTLFFGCNTFNWIFFFFCAFLFHVGFFCGSERSVRNDSSDASKFKWAQWIKKFSLGIGYYCECALAKDTNMRNFFVALSLVEKVVECSVSMLPSYSLQCNEAVSICKCVSFFPCLCSCIFFCLLSMRYANAGFIESTTRNKWDRVKSSYSHFLFTNKSKWKKENKIRIRIDSLPLNPAIFPFYLNDMYLQRALKIFLP